MDNPGNEAPSASADLPAVEAMQVENPTPPDVSAGNGKEGNDANVSPGKPTPMDTDSLSTGQTAERVSNANALITASSNTSASVSALSSAQAAASAAPTTTVGTNSSSTPSAAIIYTHACFLCCRKFTSLEQLLKHQAKSKLHKTNLEREKALKKEQEEPESESGEQKSDAGQDAQAEKGDDSSDDSNRDDEEDKDSDADSDIADGTSSSPRSSKRKHKLSQRPSSKPRRPSVRSRVEVEGPVQVWRCSSCNDAYFDTYEEAFEHEARCARRAHRESSMVDSSSEGDSIARAEAKERNALEKKKWKEEDDQLKAKGVEQGGKGVPFNLTAEDKKILSDYNRFLFENIEMFVVDQEFNDQLATSYVKVIKGGILFSHHEIYRQRRNLRSPCFYLPFLLLLVLNSEYIFYVTLQRQRHRKWKTSSTRNGGFTVCPLQIPAIWRAGSLFLCVPRQVVHLQYPPSSDGVDSFPALPESS